jgi:hypothetical protein
VRALDDLEMHPSGRNKGPTVVVVVVVVEHGKERANVAILEAPLSWSEAIRHNMDRRNLWVKLETHYVGLIN